MQKEVAIIILVLVTMVLLLTSFIGNQMDGNTITAVFIMNTLILLIVSSSQPFKEQ